MEVQAVAQAAPLVTPSVPARERTPERAAEAPRVRVAPALSNPSATYGPRGEFPRPLLIARAFSTPRRAPFASLLLRAAGRRPEPAFSDDVNLPPPFAARLAASFRNETHTRIVDAVR